jgi:dTDP-4-amino-4,6-dideoxygalactose transaminase
VFGRQLPAYSPLTWRAVAAGALATVARDGAAEAALVADLCDALRATDAVLTDSGVSALALALRDVACVALPAYSCYDIATAADGAGTSVLLYDIDPRTLGPDADSLRAALRQGANAVVVAPIFGLPVDMALVSELAAETGATIIEDAAQAAGARLNGQAVGSFGAVSVLSFGRGKGTTGGGGGALLAHDAIGRHIVAHAREAAGAAWRGFRRLPGLVGQWLLGRPAAYALPAALPFLHLGETIYRKATAPRRAPALTVGTLSQTLALAPRELAVRRANAARYMKAAVASRSVAVPEAPAAAEPGYLRFPVVCADAKWPDVARARRIGVMAAYPVALADLGGFAHRVGNRSRDFPGARLLARRLATVPTHSRVDERCRRAIEAWLASPHVPT